MKKTVFFLLVLSSFFSCLSDTESTDNDVEVTEEKIEEIAENLTAEITESIETEASEEATAAPISKEEKEEIKEIIGKQIKESSLKSVSCEEMMKKYEEVANEFVKTLDYKAFEPIKGWSNDPIFQNCIKQEPYKTQYDKLQNKMDKAEEDS